MTVKPIKTKTESSSEYGLLFGILGLVAVLLGPLGLPIQIAGFTYSIKGLKTPKRIMAILGLVFSSIGLIAEIIFLLSLVTGDNALF